MNWTTESLSDLNKQGFMKTYRKSVKAYHKQGPAKRTAVISNGTVTFNDGFSRDIEASELDELVTDLKAKGYKVTVN